jgi:hypothetical protein
MNMRSKNETLGAGQMGEAFGALAGTRSSAITMEAKSVALLKSILDGY